MTSRHTLVHRLEGWATRKPNVGALYARRPVNGWRSYTWKEYWQAVRETAKGLIALGLQPGECVALVGVNSPEWVIVQMAIMSARGIPAPIYTTNTPDQVAYILGHCQCKIAVCDGSEQLAKYAQARRRDEVKIEKTVTLTTTTEADFTLEKLRTLGAQQDDAELNARFAALDPADTALLIYTSGTTGQPKAVRLNQEGMILVGAAVREVVGDPEYRVISYLPLCHIAEQAVTHFGSLEFGGEVYFCPDLAQLKDYLAEVRPTCFLGVPRVWEKFEAAMRAKLAKTKWPKSALVAWAMRTELAAFEREVETSSEVGGLKRALARKLVIDKVKRALGFDQLVAAATGAAPISRSTLEFFASLGIPICEVYGLSETTAMATVTDPQRPAFGTVGQAVPGVEVRIADDGEILLKGKNMTQGYLHMPEETRELFDQQGWLHTGDLGQRDARGNLQITGRKKDLIITAGGKNLAPLEMEQHIAAIPGVDQAVVVGDRQPYLCALIALDPDNVETTCETLGLQPMPLSQLAKNARLRDYLQRQIEAECNAKVARYQTIKRFEVVDCEFSVEGGELTPTMKLKRNVVNDKYATLIASMYGQKAEGGASAGAKPSKAAPVVAADA